VVVVGIIAVLITLLAPAVMVARESANRQACLNNLRQIDMAMQNYVGIHEGFPSLWTYSHTWSQGKPASSANNWVPSLLPYLDQTGLADIYDRDKIFFDNTAAIAHPLKFLQCPAAPHAFDTITETWSPASAVLPASIQSILTETMTGTFTAALTDYQGFWKVSDDWKELLDYPADSPPLTGVLAVPPYSTLPQLTAWCNGGTMPLQANLRKPAEVTDGLAYSILLVEEGGRPQLWERGKLVDPNTAIANSSWPDPTGSGWLITGDQVAQCLINCNNNKNIYSFHRGGANFPFADGSVRFISQSVSNRTIVALMTAAADDVPGNDY
jgi:prepilin-type processing-associated H-X9-DG protein